MPLTQIPFEPPTEHLPEQGDLFDSNSWESAYRELHDFPTLLIQTRDELARSRKREAFWVSLVAHLVVVLLVINSPKLSAFFSQYLPHRAVILVNPDQNRNTTFLALPPDVQKVAPPKSDILSDKNRIAQSRAPKLDRDELKKILDAARQGRPGTVAPPVPQPQAAPPAQAAQAQPPQPQQAAQPQPPPQVAKLETPPIARRAVPKFPTSQPMSAEQQIAQAARSAATNRRVFTGDNGDFGLGQRQPTARMGNVEIMSDAMGVDFGPYLQRIVHDVKENWYTLIPESAQAPLYKKGKLSIEFAILKNGQIAGMRYVTSSGDIALDRAAYGGITDSTPFPPLPTEFGGQYLGLRFTFYYNPDPNSADLQ
jgi:TonB family protein